jgi:transposase InsO family protein
MRCYAGLTRERLVHRKIGLHLPEGEPTPWRQDWEARAQRHAVVQRRRQEDVAWRVERETHHGLVAAYRALSPQARAAQADEWQTQQAQWIQHKQDRQELLEERQSENQAWHAHNRQRKHQAISVWIAILVVTDNATRQCVGLPVFANGAHVTTQAVAAALRAVLPEEVAFLISDQGAHFRSKALAHLAQERDFVHVPIYRHRPQTNGIAERFVRTLKHELHPQPWSGPEELQALLAQIVPAYNDRPHQGLPIPGLSPNEFANRLWLM